VLGTEREDTSIARGQELAFPVLAAVPNGTHGMNDEARRQIEASRDSSLASRATDAGANFGNPTTCFQQSRTRRVVNCTVHSAATEKPLVGRVDDRVDRHGRDVTELNTNFRHE